MPDNCENCEHTFKVKPELSPLEKAWKKHLITFRLDTIYGPSPLEWRGFQGGYKRGRRERLEEVRAVIKNEVAEEIRFSSGSPVISVLSTLGIFRRLDKLESEDLE